MRLERDPDYWELRAYAGRDPITGRPRYVSRSFRGGKRDAGKALTQFVTEIEVKGTQADLSVDGLMTSHIDHLEQARRSRLRARWDQSRWDRTSLPTQSGHD